MRTEDDLVAILEAEPMAREDYISYGAWTFGMGVRWDGPVIVTAGLGLVVGSAKQLLPDYSLASYSYTGVGALVHGVLPVARVGHPRIGLAGNLEAKTLGPNTVTGLSVGAAVIW